MRSTFLFRGSKINYSSKGKGRALIFVHGFLGSRDLWKEQIRFFSSKYRVITLDLPGHGGSESLGYVHSMELLADLIKGLMKHLNLRKIILVGHSMGGYAAMAFAEKYTDHLLALILVNSTAATDSESRRRSREQLIQLLPKDSKRILKSLVESFFVIDQFKRRYAVKKYLNWAYDCDLRGILASIRGMMERKERLIVLKFAPYPYLIISGEKDPIIDLDQNRSESDLSPNGELSILEESGHISPMEQPSRLNILIKTFLKEQGLN